MAKVYVLGSAQDGGLPQFGARHAHDVAARGNPALQRLGPSLAVIDGERALLIDVSPDIKAQHERLLAVPEYANGGARTGMSAPPIFDAIVLTHAHIGHYAGLIHFGREAASTKEIPCFVTKSMAKFLRDNGPWDQLIKLNNLKLVEITPGKPFLPWPGLELTALTVPHRGEYTDTVGLSLNGRVLYVPDIDDWKQWPQARETIERHEVSLLDATFFSDDELGPRAMKEVPHPRVTETLKYFGELAGKRRLVLTHLNHTNPLCDPRHDAHKQVEKAGFEVASEMMSFDLGPVRVPAKVEVPRDFSAVVVTLPARADAATLPVMRAAAERFGVRDIHAHRIIHARQIEQLDSSSLATLFDLIEEVGKSGHEVIICDPPPALQKYIEVYHAQSALCKNFSLVDARGRHESKLIDFIPPFVPAPKGRVDIYTRGELKSFGFGPSELTPAPAVNLAEAVLSPPKWAKK
ncbi:MAG: hypothetical protein IT462_17870 [Planctomycetes bacterium]|nr:hypothetical protein [Planctomycetota bacterium]